jgi:hypothetical protein
MALQGIKLEYLIAPTYNGKTHKRDKKVFLIFVPGFLQTLVQLHSLGQDRLWSKPVVWPGANVIKLFFSSSTMLRTDKLECFSLVHILRGIYYGGQH